MIAPYSDDFEWSPENEDIIVAPQQAIAVYFNAWGQVVIRASAEDVRDVDAFICISPEHLPPARGDRQVECDPEGEGGMTRKPAGFTLAAGRSGRLLV